MKYKNKLLLLSIIIFGSFLRLYNLSHTLIIDTDQAAAYLLADRIINHGHILLNGPLTSFWEINILPPIYYYIVTFIYFFTRSELWTAFVFSLFGIGSIILIYLVAEQMFNESTSLIAALLYASSATMIDYSRNIWEPHLVPFFILLSFYLLLQFFQRKKLLFFILSVFSYAISFMYISSFLLLPTFFLLCFYYYKWTLPKNKFSFIITMSIFIIIFSLIYLPVLIFEYQHNFPSYYYLIRALSGSTRYFHYDIILFLKSVIQHIKIFIASTIRDNNFASIILTILIIFTYCINILKSNIKAKTKNFWRFTILIILISAFILCGFWHEKTQVYRLAAIYPVFYLLISDLITRYSSIFMNKTRFIYMPMLIIYFLLMMIIYRNLSITKKIMTTKTEPYAEKIIMYILSSANNTSFSLFTITPYEKNNHHSTLYYYFIEKSLQKKLVNLNDRGNWIDQGLNTKNKWIFLICMNFSENSVEENCFNYFITRFKIRKNYEKQNVNNINIYKFDMQ